MRSTYIQCRESTIIIDGVQYLHGCEYTVMADRIAATTFMSAAAVTGSHITLKDIVRVIWNPYCPYLKRRAAATIKR